MATKHTIQYLRKLWHVSGGLLICILYELCFDKWLGACVLLCVASSYVAVDVLRSRSVRVQRYFVSSLGLVLRDSEHNELTGSSYFLVGSVLSVLLFDKRVAIVAIAALSVVDPIASFAGVYMQQWRCQVVSGERQWHRPRLLAGKSLIASSLAALVCALSTLFVLNRWQREVGELALHDMSLLSAASPIRSSLSIGIVASLAELAPLGIDDNLTIPLLTGFGINVLRYFGIVAAL
jgi:diacylglycerol kinase (CTP)